MELLPERGVEGVGRAGLEVEGADGEVVEGNLVELVVVRLDDDVVTEVGVGGGIVEITVGDGHGAAAVAGDDGGAGAELGGAAAIGGEVEAGLAGEGELVDGRGGVGDGNELRERGEGEEREGCEARSGHTGAPWGMIARRNDGRGRATGGLDD